MPNSWLICHILLHLFLYISFRNRNVFPISANKIFAALCDMTEGRLLCRFSISFSNFSELSMIIVNCQVKHMNRFSILEQKYCSCIVQWKYANVKLECKFLVFVRSIARRPLCLPTMLAFVSLDKHRNVLKSKPWTSRRAPPFDTCFDLL